MSDSQNASARDSTTHRTLSLGNEDFNLATNFQTLDRYPPPKKNVNEIRTFTILVDL
jgi:hypothetical protein